jgi:hypothetical protein
MAGFNIEREHARLIVTWDAFTQADPTGDEYTPPTNYQIESVQFIGDEGVGSADLGASNVSGGPYSTVASGVGLSEPSAQGLFYRPEVAGADAATDITAVAYFRRL